MNESDKLIINAAITGTVPMKKETPFVPTTVDEIVASARRVRDAGASIVHLHARDESGAPTSSGAAYSELVSGVREAVGDMVICVSLIGPCGKRPPKFHCLSRSTSARVTSGPTPRASHTITAVPVASDSQAQRPLAKTRSYCCINCSGS